MAVDIKFINELWVPDIYVYFLKRINVLTVFTKFAGLFIVNGNEILYSQVPRPRWNATGSWKVGGPD